VLELGHRLFDGVHRDYAGDGHAILERSVHTGEEVVEPAAQADAYLVVVHAGRTHATCRIQDRVREAEFAESLVQ
jgi:hypothetical protein